MRTILFLLASAAIQTTAQQAVVPKTGVPPIGPYTPGILANDYLYVSGQGAKKSDKERCDLGALMDGGRKF